MLSVLEIMDPSGHLTLTWNPDNPDEVKTAKAEFERLKGCGYAFFAEDKPQKKLGKRGTLDVRPVQTKELKPGRTLAVRPMRGG